jgi:serine/threonine protein kinase
LKVLPKAPVATLGFTERSTREGRVLGRLNHPSIVAVHDSGESGGHCYLLMEFVDGVNLRRAMRAGRFTPEQALKVVPDICAALQAAHEQGGSIATSIRRTSCSTQKAG